MKILFFTISLVYLNILGLFIRTFNNLESIVSYREKASEKVYIKITAAAVWKVIKVDYRKEDFFVLFNGRASLQVKPILCRCSHLLEHWKSWKLIRTLTRIGQRGQVNLSYRCRRHSCHQRQPLQTAKKIKTEVNHTMLYQCSVVIHVFINSILCLQDVTHLIFDVTLGQFYDCFLFLSLCFCLSLYFSI